MLKRILSLLIICLFAVNASASANISPDLFTVDNERNVTVIVEVEGNVIPSVKEIKRNASKSHEATLLENQAEVLSEINDATEDYIEPEYVYTSLFNGFAIKINENDIEEIKEIPGVKEVYISKTATIPKPLLESSNVLSGTIAAWETGLTGEGTAVAVIDGFFDINHTFFDFTPKNPKYSRDDIITFINSGLLNTSKSTEIYKSAKIPFVYNYEKNTTDVFSSKISHGTHVSGIIAGGYATSPDGVTDFSGVAPSSQILFMNCADSNGSLSEATILAAMNDAAVLGVDVINMSLGFVFFDSSVKLLFDTAITNARKLGISIFASAGNDGRSYNEETALTEFIDYSTTSSPGSYSVPTAVASADNSHVYSTAEGFLTYDGITINAFSLGSETEELSKLFLNDEIISYVDCQKGTSADFENKNLAGKIALCQKSEIPLTEISDNAKNSGAIGILIINNEEKLFSVSEALSLPTFGISLSEGKKLIDAENKIIAYIGTITGKLPAENGGKISYFSSWGGDSALDLKPEITAPGGNIYSSTYGDAFAALSGTSMATPHASGAALLLYEYYNSAPFIPSYNNFTNENKALLIENLLMTSANIIVQDNGVFASPRSQGAGLINAAEAIKSKVILEGSNKKAKVNLGQLSENTFDVSFTITNISKEPVTFDDIDIQLLTDGYKTKNNKTYLSESVTLPHTVVDAPDLITLSSGEKYSFTAKIALNDEFIKENKKIFTNGFFVDGFVILKDSTDSYKASLPFMGFYGSWFDLPIFDTTIYDEGSSKLLSPQTSPNYKENVYNTGTFIAIGNDAGYYIAGRNPLAPTSLSETYDKIAFSPFSGRDVYFAYKMHRPTSKRSYQVYDSEGKKIHEGTDTGKISKYTQKIFNLGLKALDLAEGDYTIKISANYIGSSYENDSIEIPIFIDRSHPEILSASYNPKTKNLALSLRDNHYLGVLLLEYNTANGSRTAVNYVLERDLTRGAEKSYSITLQDASASPDIDITVADYSLNEFTMPLTFYTSKMGFSLTSLTITEDFASAKLALRNNTPDKIEKNIILAFYDSENKLISSLVKPESFLSGEEKVLTFSTLKDLTQTQSLKMLIWDLEALNPFVSAKTFILKP